MTTFNLTIQNLSLLICQTGMMTARHYAYYKEINKQRISNFFSSQKRPSI